MIPKHHEADVENFSKLNRLNLLSDYLGIKAAKNSKDTVRNNFNTLSSTYSSYDEYNSDISTLYRYVDIHRMIPNELLDRLLRAQEELGLLKVKE